MEKTAERKIIAERMKFLSITQFVHIRNSTRLHAQHYGGQKIEQDLLFTFKEKELNGKKIHKYITTITQTRNKRYPIKRITQV